MQRIVENQVKTENNKNTAQVFSNSPTGILRPNKATLAASCLASFLVPQYFMLVNVCPLTNTLAPNPPSTPGASEYLGTLILLFWQY